MELSQERKVRLESLYARWGVDRVRAEVARNDREPFAEPDVVEFSRAWVAARDKTMRRRRRTTDMLIFVGFLMVGALAFALFYP